MKNFKLAKYVLVGLIMFQPLQVKAVSFSDANYERFLSRAVNCSLNAENPSTLNYVDFLKIAFEEYIEQTYWDFLKESKKNLFVSYSEYMDIIIENNVLERSYEDFLSIMQKEQVKPTDEEVNASDHLFKDYLFPLGTYTHITSPYGMRGNAFHYGVDFKAPIGTPIVSAQSGIAYVVRPDSKGLDKGGGNMVFIKHPDGHETRYMHLDRYAVKEGDKVEKGQVIGYVGNTGYSTGSHLHLELLVEGERHIDASILLK